VTNSTASIYANPRHVFFRMRDRTGAGAGTFDKMLVSTTRHNHWIGAVDASFDIPEWKVLSCPAYRQI
jgi:hypothetical protein